MYSPAPGMQPADVAFKQPEEAASKPKASSKQKPKTNLDQFIRELTGLASYMNELRIQAHLIHFNYEAGNFLGVHKFLGKQYKAHQDQFDKIGEFIRSLDYLLPMCHRGLMAASPEFKHCNSYKATEMLGVYYKNLEELGMKAKKLESIAAKVGAIDVQNYLSELVGEAFKASWMIKSCLRNA